MNLILAVVYQNYGDSVKSTLIKDFRYRLQTLKEAFHLLKNDKDVVTFDIFEKGFFLIICFDSVVVIIHTNYKFSSDVIRFIFHILDKDHDNELSNKKIQFF